MTDTVDHGRSLAAAAAEDVDQAAPAPAGTEVGATVAPGRETGPSGADAADASRGPGEPLAGGIRVLPPGGHGPALPVPERDGSAVAGSAAAGPAAEGSSADGLAADRSAAAESIVDGSAAVGSADGSAAAESAAVGSAADGSAAAGSVVDGSVAGGPPEEPVLGAESPSAGPDPADAPASATASSAAGVPSADPDSVAAPAPAAAASAAGGPSAGPDPADAPASATASSAAGGPSADPDCVGAPAPAAAASPAGGPPSKSGSADVPVPGTAESAADAPDRAAPVRPPAGSRNGRPMGGPTGRAGVPPLVAIPAPWPVPARVAGRHRRPAADVADEQAAADQALLRTFGVADRAAGRPAPPSPAVPAAGAAQPVAVHVVGRDGSPLAGASVTLHDDQGRETATATTGPDGRGALTAPRPGGYVLVTAAPGHQPAAAALTVTDTPVAAPVQLTRAASLAGTVTGEDGPQVGAQVVLAEDGEAVAATETDAEGGYHLGDLAAGAYTLSVTAPECEPAAVAVQLDDAHDARADVELAPAGLPTSRS